MYRLYYLTSKGWIDYTIDPMPLAQAKDCLSRFIDKYLNLDGTGKTFPNGKGTYDISFPRLVKVA